MPADLRQRVLVVVELDELAPGRRAEAVAVGDHQRPAALDELRQVRVVDLGAHNRHAGAPGVLPVGAAVLQLLQRLAQVRQDLALGTDVGHEVDDVELVAGDDRVRALAHLADLLNDAADLVVLGHRAADGRVRGVRPEDLRQPVQHAHPHLPGVTGQGVVGDLEGHVAVGHKEFRIVVDLQDLKMLHRTVHHRAGIDPDQRVQEAVPALDGALEQGAGELAGVVGHVVGGDVNGAGVRGAEPGRKAAVNVEKNLGNVEAGISEADAPLLLPLLDQLVVGILKQSLEVDQMLQIFQMLHLFFC